MTAQPLVSLSTVDDNPPGVPDLDEVAGEWIHAEELAHLPSLRNQRGQAHVNEDLTSLSWLASPPYTFGYHTGVLRVDGTVLPAQRYRWKPWGVRREHRSAGLRLLTDTRMVLSDDLVLWRVEVHNETDAVRTVTLTQDLSAMVAHTETGWGWLYDVPWSHGDHHDYFTLERIRRTTAVPDGAAPYLLGSGPRRLRVGRPRTPGIQRDEDGRAMLLEYELPHHVSPDRPDNRPDAAAGTLRYLRCVAPGGRVSVEHLVPLDLHAATEHTLGDFELSAGTTVELEYRPAQPHTSGVIFTHGNHPDSLQLGLSGGRLWFGIAGEREYADTPLRAGVWYPIRLRVDGDRVALLVGGEQAAVTRHWSHSRRWLTAIVGGRAVLTADQRSAARAGYAFDTAPTVLEQHGGGARARWSLVLPPGRTQQLGIVCAYGRDSDDVVERATAAAAAFPVAFDGVETGTRRLWRSMFTPGNPDFSGHLPTLHTANVELSRAYYMGALVTLYLRNLHVSATGPVFLTGGPRLGPTTTFYWDHAEWSRMYALLEPEGLRSWLLRVLSGPYDRTFGIDTRHGGGLGNFYAANHYALFRLIEHYVCLTGDTGFLDERAGPTTVLGHLEELAHGWRDQRDRATGATLADFGPDAWRLLECVPNYIHVVASFNAAYVAMMRSLAALLRHRGRHDDAVRTQTQAAVLATAVLDLYVEGGRWRTRHPDGVQTIGHCLDFGLTAAALHDDLDDTRRAEMVDFVVEHLISGPWMRALALDDPIAGSSDRPDHGSGGAFGAWPGVTAHGLARLGRPDLALDLLTATPRAASGGLWGQAMEFVEDNAGIPRVRVAERGICNRDTIAAAATAEAVLSALFGLEPSFARLGASPGTTAAALPGLGALDNLNLHPAGPPVEAPTETLH